MPLTPFINNNSTFQNKTTNAISVLVICSIISNYDCSDNVDPPPSPTLSLLAQLVLNVSNLYICNSAYS